MQRRRLGDESWLYYDQEGAMRSDWLGNGVVQHTCRGEFGSALAEIVIADGERALREHGRCLFLVDASELERMLPEFRQRVTYWLAGNRRVKTHYLLKSKLIELAIRLSNIVLRRVPVEAYSSVERWEEAGRRQVEGFRRLPLIPAKGVLKEPVFESEHSNLLILFRHLDVTQGAELDGALAVLLEQLQSWAPGFLHSQFAGVVPDIDDLSDDAVQHLVLAVSARKFDLTAFAAEASVMAWCQAVLTNFVLSELRYRRRSSQLPAYSSGVIPHEAVDERNAFEVLVEMLRRQVGESAPRRQARQRLALLDDFFANVTSPTFPVDRRTANRLSQRRARARKITRQAWLDAKNEGVPGELFAIAYLLGLEDEATTNRRPAAFPV